MIRILIEDGDVVLVDALVDVPARRVESLWVETSKGLDEAYLAEALLALELEIEMEARRVRKPETRLTLDTSKFEAALQNAKRGFGDLGTGALKPVLTSEQMATAMGLVRVWAHACAGACEVCDEADIRWVRREGQVLLGWCGGCLPAAFEQHMREQGEMDRLVEADDGLKPELPTGRRPEAPTCEGGCE